MFILKGVLKEDLGDTLANDKVKYIYSLNNEAIAELEDSLSIPIYSNGSDISLVFPPVGVNIQGSGSYVAQFRSSFFDIDIRGNGFAEVAEDIDSLLVRLLPLKSNVIAEFPKRIIKAIVTLLFESESSNFKGNLLKIATTDTSRHFFNEFDCKYNEKNSSTEEHIIKRDYIVLIGILARIDKKKNTPNKKGKLINDVLKKAESLKQSLIKNEATPNVYDLINFAAKSESASKARQISLYNMSSRLWGCGASHDFPTLEELLDGYIQALSSIDVKKQNKLNDAFSFYENVSSEHLAHLMYADDFETTDVRTRYDRRVFSYCESVLEEIPTSLSRIFDSMFNYGRDFNHSKTAYWKWKKDKKKKAKNKLQ